MDLDRLQSDLQRLAEIVGGWDASKEIDALERDLVLEKLRNLYETVRFGARPETVSAEPAAAEPSVPIDLGEVLSLDPLAEMPEAGETQPEETPAFEESVPFEPEPVSEPELEALAAPAPEPTREAEPSEEPAAGNPAVPVSATPSAEISVSEPEPTPEPTPEPEPEPESVADPEPAAELVGEEPASRDPESPAVEAFISASVAESTHESPAASDADATSNSDHPREKSAAQTLFGVEEPASRHRHKQRVIMSLYGSDTPERKPATPVGEASPAESVSVSAPVHEPVRPVHPATETPTPTLSDAAAPGAVLGEVINANVHTLADTIAPPHDIASELRRSDPVTDLHRAIGINDKFLMIRDLFGGDGEAFERAIEALNGFDNLDDCMIYVAENYAWNANSDGAKLLMELLERKFA